MFLVFDKVKYLIFLFGEKILYIIGLYENRKKLVEYWIIIMI